MIADKILLPIYVISTNMDNDHWLFVLQKKNIVQPFHDILHLGTREATLIEEFMLLANMAVAHIIYGLFHEQALLRRHPPPQTNMLDDLAAFFEELGVKLDLRTAGALHNTLNETVGNDQYSAARKEVLTHMCSRPMQSVNHIVMGQESHVGQVRSVMSGFIHPNIINLSIYIYINDFMNEKEHKKMAQYFCTGVLRDETLFRHYALNVPLYTHFTSPIRRYADIIVHRLLAASLGSGHQFGLDKSDIQKQADHCNAKKSASKKVQELSTDIFFSVFVK
eukprot:g48019.t1